MANLGEFPFNELKFEMRKSFLLMALVVGLFWSCDKTTGIVEDNEITSNQLLDGDLLNALNNTKWEMVSCPPDRIINLNGYSECDYFMELEFIGRKVFIQHSNADLPPTPHHICSSSGTVLPISIQACTNSTWRPMFHINITKLTSTTLEFTLFDVGFIDGFQGKYKFRKV